MVQPELILRSVRMVAIVNIGPHDDLDLSGWRNYEVRINHEVIAKFRHKREHGLARCLRMAAAAVEARRAKELQAYFGEESEDAGQVHGF